MSSTSTAVLYLDTWHPLWIDVCCVVVLALSVHCFVRNEFVFAVLCATCDWISRIVAVTRADKRRMEVGVKDRFKKKTGAQ